MVIGLRNWLVEYLEVPEDHQGRPDGQEMYLGIISLSLSLSPAEGVGRPRLGLPDERVRWYPLGVDMTMPRTPAVFDEKTKWSLSDLEGELDKDVLNYKSTEGFGGKIEALFREEEQAGLDGRHERGRGLGAGHGHGRGSDERCSQPVAWGRAGNRRSDGRASSAC